MNDQLERGIRNLFCNTGELSRDEVTSILLGLLERIQHLEQLRPEQEPVAWLYRDSWGVMKLSQVTPPPVGAFPVYTAPPQRQWVGLTDKEAMQICMDCGCMSEDWLTLLDAIEAKLKEKNT